MGGAINLRDKQGQIMMIFMGQALDLGHCRQKEAFEKILSRRVTWPQLHFGKSPWELCETGRPSRSRMTYNPGEK